MKIDGWHIDGYGVHHDLGVADLPSGLTIVTGPNEAGKTTLQHFLVGMLFGFTPSHRPDHHEPLRGGTYGGRLHVTDEHGIPFTIHRGARRSSLRITGPDGPVADPEAELRRLLGGAAKDLYLALFAVHTDELDELKALTEDQVRDRVFSAGILGAGRTASAALGQLTERRDDLWKPGGRKADRYELHRLRDQLVDARSQLAEARREATGLPALLHRIGTVEADRQRAYDARSELQAQRSLLFVVSTQWETWAQAEEARAELNQLGEVAPVPPGMGTLLDQLVERRTDLRAEADRCDEALAEARLAADALEQPGPALEHAEEIARLAATLAVEDDRATTLERLLAEEERAEHELAEALATLGPDASEAWLDAQTVHPAALAELRSAAAEVARAERQDADARAAAEQATAAHRDADDELRAAEAVLAARTVHPVDRAVRAVDDASTLVALLTQRDVVAHRAATAPAPGFLLPALLGAAALAVLGGVGAIATGAPAIGAVVLVLAVALGGLALAARRPTAPAVDLSEIDAAIEPLIASLRLPSRPTLIEATSVRTRAEQLAAEARQHERDLAELQARRQAHDARTARLVAQQASAEADGRAALEHARAAWAAALAQHGLPAELDPVGATDLVEGIARARTLLRTVRQLRTTVATARAARAAHTEAVVALARTSGLASQADAAARPLAVIAELDAARRRAEAAQQAIDAQAVAVRAAEAQHQRAAERAQEATAALEQQIAELGAATLAEARTLIERAELAGRLRRTIAQADRDLAQSIGPDPQRLEAARALLTRADPLRWERELDELDRQLRAIDGEIEDRTAELTHLGADRQRLERSADVAAAELRVADLEAQLTDALTRFATLATAHQVVEATLARYQRERQPEVVQRAAAHFTRLTDGAYVRLEVRDREIVAIDRTEREVPAHRLSKGATQQLYLCMRFALAESYARTTPLPLLLDDIAVHTDDHRHLRLADAVAEVAVEHQVLVFTSHERTASQLQAASPGSRLLELRGAAPSALRSPSVA